MAISLQEWTKLSGEITDADLREDFHRIQMQLSQIIVEDVMVEGGSLHNVRGRPCLTRYIIKESLASLDILLTKYISQSISRAV